MEQTFFYVAGSVLVVLALVVTAIGLRFESFPASRLALGGGIAAFVVVVLATAAGAVINARDEQEERRAELAEEAVAEAQTGEESTAAEKTGTEGPAGATQQEQEAAQEQQEQPAGAEGGAGETLELTSPKDGGLTFDPPKLEAAAGTVTIDYTNPSPAQHNVAIEAGGQTLDEGDLVTDGALSTATAELKPGEYVFYCAVPGHREGGMEGTLTVK